VLAFAGASSGPALAGLNAIVADLTEPGTREDAYAAVRVASNLGAALGPAIGGLLIALGSWTAFLVGVAVLGAAAVAVCQLALPAPAPLPAEDRRAGSLRAISRDRAFSL